MARRTYRLITYSLNQDPAGAVRRASSVPASVDVQALSPGGRVHVQAEVPITDPALRDRFWWGRHQQGRHSVQQVVVSTDEVVVLLEQGYIVEVISGPHGTRREAHYRADVAWEEPE